MGKWLAPTSASFVHCLSARPAHLALFGANQLLHDFVHAFERFLLVLAGPCLVAADRRHQRRRAIRDDIAHARMRHQFAVIAAQRRGRKLASDAQIDRNGAIGKPDHLAAKLPPGHAFARLKIGQHLVIAHQLVVGRVLARRLPIDTQRLVEAALGLSFEAPEGAIQIDPDNNHTWLTPRIGRVRRDGSFDVVWEAKAAVKPDPYLAVSPLGARWIGEEVSVA